jgi:mannosyltransferase
MAATVTAPQPTVPVGRAPEIDSGPEWDLQIPERVAGIPRKYVLGGLLLIAMAISGVLRSAHLGGQFWMDEGLSVGISTHPLLDIPTVLRHDGSPPLYYMLLHVWMSTFGSSETSTHAMSLVFGLLTIPAGAWVAWSLFGRWAAAITTVLFALNPFLTAYSQETRMYSLMALLGLLATGAFIHAFIYRRRRYLILFTACQTLMLYTHIWGAFFGVGAAIAFLFVWRTAEDRTGLWKDALLAFGGAAVLYLPWVPTLIYQATHTGSPWDSAPNFGAPVQISRNLMGGDRGSVAMVLAAAIGLGVLFTRARRRSRESLVLWTLILIPLGALGFGWIMSHVSPAWAYRYFAPVLGSMLLVLGWGMSRAKIVGLLAIILIVTFWVNPGSFTPPNKSDMRDLAGEMGPLLHRGDVVVLGQPEQVPLAWYYLPAGLRFADTTGMSKDPQSMNWVNALSRLQNATPSRTLGALIATLKPGQQVLFIRPLTEGAQNWQAPWTSLVRRRSAQWGALLASNPSLKPVAWAPHNYRGACCVADSALLYRKL